MQIVSYHSHTHRLTHDYTHWSLYISINWWIMFRWPFNHLLNTRNAFWLKQWWEYIIYLIVLHTRCWKKEWITYLQGSNSLFFCNRFCRKFCDEELSFNVDSFLGYLYKNVMWFICKRFSYFNIVLFIFNYSFSHFQN